MNFVEASLKYRQVTLAVLLLFFAVGVYSLLNMPRREDPKITIRQGLVIAYYPGATAEQVEEQVTQKLEQYLFQFEEVVKDKTYSTTQDGMVVVNVELSEKVKSPDIFWSKLRHQLLVAKQVDFPAGVRGPIVNSDFGDTEAMVIGISGNKAGYSELKQYAQLLEDRLRTITSVSKIKRVGEQKEQIVVSSNSQKLSQYGVKVQDVMKVLQSQNDVYPSGEIKTGNDQASLYTKGYFQTQEDLSRQVIGASNTGAIVRLGDIATLTRGYAEPASKTLVNGTPAIFVTIQMLEGNNIVKFGKEVRAVIADFQKTLPSGINVTTVIDQPTIVDSNISHFIREFFLAILSVVIVVILLLPLRVAMVAAMAIPMTVAVTFALLELFGIDLHQVSLAALIVVLGMVVDDAIVIADNYVELLDNGVDRWTAAWRSASDLVVPVLAATLTIIAAFIPMVLLTGAIGEFIHALPITVAIALASSFIVAMFLTPMLCFFFIKKGLHDHSAEADKHKKPSFLDRMQAGYNRMLDWCVAHPKLTIFGSFVPVVLAILLYTGGIRQKFFPAAERNQFVVELWMPTGTRLEATEKAILNIQQLVQKDKRVTAFATFIGTSAPRFYYNFSPEVPVPNYALLLINTTTEETTLELYEELSQKVEALVPQGSPEVKLMQQGQVLKAPVEVRITGDDVAPLKAIAQDVEKIIRNAKGSRHLRSDFREDFYGYDIAVKPEAERLGFTTESIAKMVYTGFKGAPVTTLREGSNAVEVLFRMDEEGRASTNDLQNVYLASPVTGARVPLNQLADLTPSWHTGKLMHRNGVRTLTVQSETMPGVLASELLKEIKPQIAQLQLPEGYTIRYGGEQANKDETMGKMVLVLFISLLLIFFILLFQFRNLKEVAIIMFTIPLSLFGAMLGLFITGNNFGFTAFIGLISLSGIVVRNAIILIDHTNELMAHGMSLREAAIESGKRRLRPIFLTAMAAAIGVLPMIISGSPMWSPLASVIAVGVVWSMIMALLTVPVLYITWKPHVRVLQGAPVLLLCAGLGMSSMAHGQDGKKITLEQATGAALQQNHLLKAKQLQVQEQQAKLKEGNIKKYPVATLNSTYQYNGKTGELVIPKGVLGGTLPLTPLAFELGSHQTFNAGVTVYQPITQLGKINTGQEITKTDIAIGEAEQQQATLQLTQAVEKLYYGLLIVQKQKLEATSKLEVARLKLYDVQSALMGGKTIDLSETGLKANIEDEEQNLLKLGFLEQDYAADFKLLTGLETDSLQLEDVVIPELPQLSVADIKASAAKNNTDLKLATIKSHKSELAVKATQQSYLPDLGVIGGYTYQEGNAIYPKNNPFIGVNFKWNIQDVLTNKQVLSQRRLVQQQASENLQYTREQTEVNIEKAYRRVKQSAQLIQVAGKAVDYRSKDLKVEEDRKFAGLTTDIKVLEAKSALAKSQADLYAAQLSYRQALSDLNRLTQ